MSVLNELVDYEAPKQNYVSLTPDKHHVGGLYEKLQIQMLRIKLALLDSDIRISESNPNDPEDCIVYSTKSPSYTKVQIKSSTVFSSKKNKNQLGKNGRTDCWSFAMYEDDVKKYIDNNIKYFIFTTSVENNLSYSGIDRHKKVTSIYSWIVPSEHVLNYWKNRASKADYSINIHDGKFEYEYFENYQLILDHIYG